MKTPSKLKVIELFAGVGGFRLGLEANNPSENENFEIILFVFISP